MGILSGYRVVDLTIAMAGPLAAMRLGDLGADVVKVEPVSGEWQRHTPAGGAEGHQINASFLSLNRNKRSLAVNLKSPEGRDIVLELARRSEVFLQNYRPGVAERLGLDYESVRAVRPDIVYVSISGYGESGPYVGRPGQDMLLQAMSGAMLNVGRASDPPAPAGTYAVDAITGYGAFEGALAGLLHRERTGEGQLVTVNMLDSAIAVQAQELSIYTVGGIPQHRGREVHGHAYIRAPYGTFATADGYLALAFPPLAELGEVLGIGEFAGMDDDAYTAACVQDLRHVLATATAGDVACLIAEPVQGVGGFTMPPDGLLGDYAAVLRERGALLISDEVQTAWGRTGENFWGIGAHGVTPDIITFAKGLGNGLAIGGVIARGDLMDGLPGNGISTFGGNPLSTAAANATLDYVLSHDLQRNAAELGGMIISGLREAAAPLAAVGEVRGKGLMFAVDLVDPATGAPSPALAARMLEETRERGLLIGKGGLYGHTLRMAPPMNLSEAEAKEGLGILADALRAVNEEAGK